MALARKLDQEFWLRIGECDRLETMKYRVLGRTGLKVSEIGFGAWGIGKGLWIGASDDESLKALSRSIDLGLNFIDTALGYGDGHSEQLVGQLVRQRSEAVYVATKIPPKNEVWPARPGLTGSTLNPRSDRYLVTM